jgi:hypothetical protein
MVISNSAEAIELAPLRVWVAVIDHVPCCNVGRSQLVEPELIVQVRVVAASVAEIVAVAPVSKLAIEIVGVESLV